MLKSQLTELLRKVSLMIKRDFFFFLKRDDFFYLLPRTTAVILWPWEELRHMLRMEDNKDGKNLVLSWCHWASRFLLRKPYLIDNNYSLLSCQFWVILSFICSLKVLYWICPSLEYFKVIINFLWHKALYRIHPFIHLFINFLNKYLLRKGSNRESWSNNHMHI